ncbi:CoA transferase [Labrenzia sp. DG1229]|uniref:CaiB/BaiF CoA transferase family protein n=1 Tax=Labrenzia sp. DG1229 TaxID=681847 RepID=UPI00048D8255|nr:CoA transferase [Labrenzia sp. DG1229]
MDKLHRNNGEEVAALKGVRIIDLSIITAGGNTTQMLADLGAEIIKVESGGYPDPFRFWAGSQREAASDSKSWNCAPTFNMLNRSKLGITLDLKSEDGRKLLFKLVREADAVTENFRRGVLERLGVGYQALKEVNPRIVLVSITSQGLDGPHSEYRSYGATLEALSGFGSVTGYDEEEPSWSGREVNYPDQVASIVAAGTLIAALRQRDRSGVGSHVDVSQREVMTVAVADRIVEFTAGGAVPKPQGNRREPIPIERCIACAGDDAWVALSVHDEEIPALSRLLGLSEQSDLAALDAELTKWSASRERKVAAGELRAIGLCAGIVANGKDLLEDPHLRARDFWHTVVHEEAGPQTLRLAPYRLSLYAAEQSVLRCPCLGEHTEDVLKALADVSDQELLALSERGVTAGYLG